MSFGLVRIGTAQDARRHVARVVLVVEDLGRLDIRHLLPGRDLDVEMGLDEPVFLAGRLDQIDPQGVVRDRLARRQHVRSRDSPRGPTPRRPVDQDHAMLLAASCRCRS